MSRRATWSIGLALCLSSTPAAAEDDEGRARDLFFEGHSAADAGDHATACLKFRESLALFRRVSTLLNLGECSEAVGEIAAALRYWTEGAALLEPRDPRMALAKERIVALEARVPQLSLALPEPLPEAAVVELDGDALPPRRQRAILPLQPGPHRVVLRVPGHQPSVVELELREGDRRRVDLPLGAPLPEPAVAPRPFEAPAPPELDDVQIAGVVIGAVGLAALVAGAVTGGLVLDRKATVEDLCEDDVCTDQAGVEAARSGRTLATVSTVGFAVGGAAVATGLIMLLVGEPPATVSAAVTSEGASLSLVTRW